MTEYLLSGDRPIAHITTFRLSDDAPVDRFVALWTEVGNLMAKHAGFVSARLYHPIVGAEPEEYIHVAQWTCAALLADAQSDPEIRALERGMERLVTSRRRVLYDAASEAITLSR